MGIEDRDYTRQRRREQFEAWLNDDTWPAAPSRKRAQAPRVRQGFRHSGWLAGLVLFLFFVFIVSQAYYAEQYNSLSNHNWATTEALSWEDKVRQRGGTILVEDKPAPRDAQGRECKHMSISELRPDGVILPYRTWTACTNPS